MPDTRAVPVRPVLGAGHDLQAATDVVAAFVAELQEGYDNHAASIADRSFAADVAWGSPFGTTIHRFDRIFAIHERLQRQGTGGPSSRYEIDRVMPVTADVIVAHVARRALDTDGRLIEVTRQTGAVFSEMALYVLVRRDGTWWLAAGQNTHIRPGGAG